MSAAERSAEVACLAWAVFGFPAGALFATFAARAQWRRYNYCATCDRLDCAREHDVTPPVVRDAAGQATVSEDLAREHYLFINMRDIGCSGCRVRYDVVGREAAEAAHAEHLASLSAPPGAQS